MISLAKAIGSLTNGGVSVTLIVAVMIVSASFQQNVAGGMAYVKRVSDWTYDVDEKGKPYIQADFIGGKIGCERRPRELGYAKINGALAEVAFSFPDDITPLSSFPTNNNHAVTMIVVGKARWTFSNKTVLDQAESVVFTTEHQCPSQIVSGRWEFAVNF